MMLPEPLPFDQASGLRTAASKPVHVVAVTSGKGGVGKTSVSVNLAMAMAGSGRRTLLLDADLGLANVDVLLGLTPSCTLADVLEGRCRLEDTILEAPRGLLVVPAASGKRHMAELRQVEHIGVIRAFSELNRTIDAMVVDTAAGITDSVLTFAQAAQEIIVVVCNEPASITDAYALIKVLSRERGVQRVHVLANMARSPTEGQELFDKLARVSNRFLDVTLDFVGTVPNDDWLRRAVQRQQAVMDAYPASASAAAFRALARRTEQWRSPRGPRGHVEFFVERLIGTTGVAA